MLGKAIINKQLGEEFHYNQQNGSKVHGKILGFQFEREEIGKIYIKSKD